MPENFPVPDDPAPHEYERLLDVMRAILDRTALALHGGPLPNGQWSWHDLPILVERLRQGDDPARDPVEPTRWPESRDPQAGFDLLVATLLGEPLHGVRPLLPEPRYGQDVALVAHLIDRLRLNERVVSAALHALVGQWRSEGFDSATYADQLAAVAGDA